jgi:hypothetical protein
MSRARAAALATVSVAATLALAACGGGTTPAASPASGSASAATSAAAEQTPNGAADKSAQEILADAQAAAKTQSSVRVAADSAGANAFDFDLQLSQGSGGQGSITVEGKTLQIIATGDKVYIKSDATFWEENIGAEAAAQLGDKWLEVPATGSAFSDVASVADYDQVIGGLLEPSGEITKGQVAEAEGQPAVALNSENGTLWVATTGLPLPLLIEQQGSDGGRATFTEWDAPVTVAAPPADQVVTEDSLPLPSVEPSAS